MPKQFSPNYFEACIASAITRETRSEENSKQQAANLKLYSKAQLCRDEAYKKPGFAAAIILEGKDYGGFVELDEQLYNSIAAKFNAGESNNADSFKAEIANDATDLPPIELYSVSASEAKPEIVMLGKFQFTVDLEKAKTTLNSHTKNLLIADNASDRENT